MEAKVTWKGRMSFEGGAGTGFKVPLGAEPAVGGDNDGFRPMELLLVGLAGCTAMDVISILRKRREDITAFEVSVKGDRAEDHPRVFTHIQIEYSITGRQVSENAVQQAIDLSKTKYCPAQAMFSQVVPIEIIYSIHQVD
jgi:putative redox protein